MKTKCLPLILCLLAVFAPPGIAQEKFTRFYPVDPDVFASTGAIVPPRSPASPFEDPQPRTSFGQNVMAFFQRLGVPFREGSAAIYQPRLGQIVVVADREAHEIFEKILNLINKPPTYVKIDATYLDIPHTLVAETPRGPDVLPGELTLKEVLSIWEAGKASLVWSGSVLTLSGVNAQVESVQQITYTTTFEATEHGIIPAKDSIDTREVGHIVNVTPMVSPDDKTINLALIPESSIRLEDTVLMSNTVDGATQRITIPTFQTFNLTTSIVVFHGQMYLMPMGRMPDGDNHRFLLLKASVEPAKRPEILEVTSPPNEGEIAAAKNRKTMEAIKIEKLSFKDTKINDVMDFLMAASRDPKNGGPEGGINMVLDRSSFSDLPLPTVNMTLERVFFSDTLDFICNVTDLSAKLDKEGVVVLYKRAPLLPIPKPAAKKSDAAVPQPIQGFFADPSGNDPFEDDPFGGKVAPK